MPRPESFPIRGGLAASFFWGFLMLQGSLPSVMGHSFSLSPQAQIPRSSFDRSFGHKTTFNAGYLIPVFVDEALPGDTFNVNMTSFARLATPIFPLMDNLFMETFFFSIPYRLVWDNWEKFNGAQDNPDDSTDFTIPYIDAPSVTGFTADSLFDYMGFPTGVASLRTHQMFHRAYNLVWNQWFRDENLQDSVIVDKDNGPDSIVDYVLLQRGKRYDYFTSCLPWPQKGPAVELPLGTTAPVKWDYISGTNTIDDQFVYLNSGGTPSVTGTYADATYGTIAGGAAFPANSNYNMFADLSLATAATINDLREAFQIQKLYERDARGGTRYIELILSHFGVRSDDARLQRAEYLGGGSTPVIITPIAQTSSTDAVTPQGNLAAIGTASCHGHGFTKSFTEHCMVLGLVCVRADLSYQQGLPRMYSRESRWDFYWPALSHIGEQAVLNKEIYCDGSANDDLVFGYQERFAEYRYKPSVVTGLFRTAAAGTLDSWHLSQYFASLPVLTSPSFIVENPPMSRIKAVPTQPDFYFDSYFKFKCARPMPMYSVPGLIDHF